jgi:hypothetical protein
MWLRGKSKICRVRFETIFVLDNKFFFLNHSQSINEFLLVLRSFPNLGKIALKPYMAKENLREFEATMAERGGEWQVVRGAEWY